MSSNGSFYQNGLPVSSANGGVGNVPAGAPAPKTAESSFYLSGSVYATLMNSDALLAVITEQQALATSAASASSGSATASAASAAAAAASAAASGLTFRGPYSAGTSYVPTDVVLDQNSSWKCLVNTTGNAPPTLPATSNTQWQVIAVGSSGTAAGISFNPTGSVAATNVQAAIAEVDGEKVAKAGDTMTGTLFVPNGTAAAPGIAFATSTNSGLSANGSALTLSFGGSSRMALGGSVVSTPVPIQGPSGTVAAPSLSWTTEPSSGFYRKSAGNVSVSVLNSEVMSWANTSKTTTAFGPIVLPADPTSALQAATKQYVDTFAPLASPVLTGVPVAPTATAGTNTTQLATTAFVLANGLDPTYLRGFISGLTLSNDPVTPNTILDIAVGVANSDDQAVLMKLTSAYTKTTGSWAVGSTNGALDTGTVANSTWYHVFQIQRPDTGVVDILFSTSPTSPTMPTNYTKKRRIGSFKTNASAQIRSFVQFGNEFLWSAPGATYSANNPGTSAVLATMDVPTGVSVRVKVTFFLQNTAAVRVGAWVTSPAQADTAANVGSAASIITGLSGAAGAAQNEVDRWTNTSGQIRYRLDASSATVDIFATTVGWLDAL